MRLWTATREYVAAKQSCGMEFRAEAYLLRRFTKAISGRTSISKVSPEAVRKFLGSPGSGIAYWNKKYHTLHGFWTFAIQRGYTNRCPLPAQSLRDFRLFSPYIYTHDELKRLLGGVSTYQNRPGKLETVTVRAMLLLLYGAGLRISEAIHLTCSDVDLADSTLLIRCTKFHKTRRIAISPQLCAVLREYDENRRKGDYVRDPASPFFTYHDGGIIKRGVFETGFRNLRHHVGIGPTKGRKQPRVHDLRHTFAVHRVISWYRSGSDVQRLLSGLSTHLGHVDLFSTQVYLTMTPELLVEASLRFERYAEEVVHGKA